MSISKGLIGLAALWLPLSIAVSQTESTSPSSSSTPDTAELLRRLQEQEQRTAILERKLELQEEANQAAAASVAQVRAGATRFSFQSADGANSVRLRGLLHFDGRRFNDDVTAETADTWILRRVRPTIEGTVGKIYDYRFTPDFAGGRTFILDAWLAARLQPWATVTAGKFKVPVGLERLVSASDLRFIERGFPTSLVPNRDLGLQLSGDAAGGVVSYSVGYFNGVSDGGSSDNNTPADVENDTSGDWAARLFFQPFAASDRFALRGLGVGIAGTYVDSTGSAANTLLASYRTPGQQTFFSFRGNSAATATTPALNNATFADGERLRFTPQFYYYIANFGLLGEYVQVTQDVTRVNGPTTRSDSLDMDAWQLQFSWFVTGEEESYRGFTPSSTFVPGQSWGAVELVARYHELSIDDAAFVGGADSFANPDTSARKARAMGLGVNWYLNQAVKLSVNYEQTRFDGGAAGGADRPDEKALLMRTAISF